MECLCQLILFYTVGIKNNYIKNKILWGYIIFTIISDQIHIVVTVIFPSSPYYKNRHAFRQNPSTRAAFNIREAEIPTLFSEN